MTMLRRRRRELRGGSGSGSGKGKHESATAATATASDSKRDPTTTTAAAAVDWPEYITPCLLLLDLIAKPSNTPKGAELDQLRYVRQRYAEQTPQQLQEAQELVQRMQREQRLLREGSEGQQAQGQAQALALRRPGDSPQRPARPPLSDFMRWDLPSGSRIGSGSVDGGSSSIAESKEERVESGAGKNGGGLVELTTWLQPGGGACRGFMFVFVCLFSGSSVY